MNIFTRKVPINMELDQQLSLAYDDNVHNITNIHIYTIL